MPNRDPLVLTIDRGNSTLDCMLSTGLRDRLPATPAALQTFLDGAEPSRIGVVSVRSPAEDAELDALLATMGFRAEWASLGDGDLSCPLEIDYRTPETLGDDRWVAAAAAWAVVSTDTSARPPAGVVVVDAGTAVTVDLVTAPGSENARACFRGGAIAPGLTTIADGLSAKAPALPRASLPRRGDPQVRLSCEIKMPPKTSQEAVDVGVLAGFVDSVEGLVRRVARAAACVDVDTPLPCVVTGGDAEVLLRVGTQPFVSVPDLVHRGLRCLLARTPCSDF